MADMVTQDKALSSANLGATVQTLPTGDGAAYGGYGDMLTLYLAHEADDIPRWGRDPVTRDRMLRELLTLESTLAGAITTIAARNGTMTIQLDGPSRTVDQVQTMLHSADNGAGLVSLFTRVSLDLYSQDNGAFIEVARADYVSGEQALKSWTEGKPMPPVVGLNHLDAAACTRTGNPLYPVVYIDPDDASGTKHLLPWHMVCPIAEMPSPIKRQRGRQYCAVTRILEAARYMRDVTIYRREKTSGRNPAQISFVGGPSNQSIKDAMALAHERGDNRGLLRYMEPLIVASLDPTKPVSVATLEWAGLPAGFDYDAELRNYITLLALCLGEDYLTFAPLPGGNQGTATQSVMLERKSRGKGAAMWQKIVTHLMNFYGILPRTVEFSFEERDVIAEQEEAALAKTQVDTLAAAVSAGLLSVPVAQQYMADNGIILDEDYLAMLGEEDATQDETVTDEAPVAETGDIQELPEDGAVPAGGEPAGAQPDAQPVAQQQARGGSFFRKWNPDQPRDEAGRFGSGGGGGGSDDGGSSGGKGTLKTVSKPGGAYTASREQVLQHIMATNPPVQVASGEMTPDQWADRFMSDGDQEYVVMPVSPAALTMPIAAGDEGHVQDLAATDDEYATIVIDSNDKIEARYGGGKLDQAYGRQQTTVLDGKHRVTAAVQRGDRTISAAVPRQKVDYIIRESANAEMDSYIRSYVSGKGMTLTGRGSGGWTALKPDGTTTTFDVYRMTKIARNTGHTFTFWNDGSIVTLDQLQSHKSVQQQAAGGAARGSFFRKALALAWLAIRRATPRTYIKAPGDIDTIVGDFAAATEDALQGYMDGTYGRARAQRVFEAAIREAWLPAAETGYRDGGGDVAELTADDYAEVRDAERAQLGYARDFWAALPEVRKAGGDPLPRGEFYVQSLRAHYAEWRLYGAKNKMGTWIYGDTDHCPTCEWLNGQRHRASWFLERGYIPRQAGSDTLDCRGYRCQCHIQDDDGNDITL